MPTWFRRSTSGEAMSSTGRLLNTVKYEGTRTNSRASTFTQMPSTRSLRRVRNVCRGPVTVTTRS